MAETCDQTNSRPYQKLSQDEYKLLLAAIRAYCGATDTQIQRHCVQLIQRLLGISFAGLNATAENNQSGNIQILYGEAALLQGKPR